MIKSISLIHFYVAPVLILLSVIRLFSIPIKKYPMFFMFVLSNAVLGVWEMAQSIITGTYFYSIESVILGVIAGCFLSLGLRENTLPGEPRREKVLAKLPLLGAIGFLTIYNFNSVQIYRTSFLLVLLGTLGIYAKKNLKNMYFQSMVILLFLGLLAQHFEMDSIVRSVLITLGLKLIAFKLPSLERNND